jgi:hypothetical protein
MQTTFKVLMITNIIKKINSTYKFFLNKMNGQTLGTENKNDMYCGTEGVVVEYCGTKRVRAQGMAGRRRRSCTDRTYRPDASGAPLLSQMSPRFFSLGLIAVCRVMTNCSLPTINYTRYDVLFDR